MPNVITQVNCPKIALKMIEGGSLLRECMPFEEINNSDNMLLEQISLVHTEDLDGNAFFEDPYFIQIIALFKISTSINVYSPWNLTCMSELYKCSTKYSKMV